ncbi:MAG: OmpA family protein [Myxococcales bacterium]|nr:OmpA family protein [Myxococcales bacterium]
MRRSLRFLPALLALAVAGPAPAQNVQNFKPTVGTWNYFTAEGARTARHLEFVPSLYLSYAKTPLAVRDAAGNIQEKLVDHLAAANLLFTLGFFDMLELGLDIPVAYVAGDAQLAGVAISGDGAALGDIRVIPKVRLFGLDKKSKGRGFGMAISVPVELPTGDADKYFGNDQVVANPKLILEGRGRLFSFAANGGVRVRPDSQAVTIANATGGLDLGTEATYSAAMGIGLGTERVWLLLEAFGAAPLEDISSDSQSSPLEALGGLRIFTPPGATITLGGGAGIVADYGSPIWRAFLGFAWHDQRYDADKDGILDEDDKCVDDPEDKDEFEDADGCPEPDNDQDGVLDVDDKCPLDAEDKDGFEDVDGCPDPDNDQDGFLDAQDQCPNEAETKNNYKDEDGCPDDIPDTDGDGLLDPNDKCPTEAEDKDGFADEDGCPDPDNDQDGILDVSDKCPMEPETINEFEDADGCPDKKPEIKLTLVKVTKQKIEILQKVYFNTAKATIKPVSFAVLNEVAEVLKSYAYIKKVRVEGHTDSVGPDKYNKDLSQKRSESVREYLIKKGVEPERLEAVGYGEEVPIDTNKTKDGRANNRRVEFTILEQ